MRPDPTDRWIGPRRPDDDPVDALLERLDAAHLLGIATDALDLSTPITGSLVHARTLAEPSTPPRALVTGTLDGVSDGEVLVAVDGVIVSGSALFESAEGATSYAAIIPRSLLGEPIEPELFWWSGGDTVARIRITD